MGGHVIKTDNKATINQPGRHSRNRYSEFSNHHNVTKCDVIRGGGGGGGAEYSGQIVGKHWIYCQLPAV